MDDGTSDASAVAIRAVEDEEWPVVRWLWQLFRYDLAAVTDGFPYGDGRYQARALDGLPAADVVGYAAWRKHPRTGERAPVAFIVVDGLTGDRRSVLGFWVLPQVRRTGLGRRLALHALARHPGPWLIGFQHENAAAGAFWRSVCDDAFGVDAWSEVRSPVTTRPDVPDDHLILTSRSADGEGPDRR